MPFTPTYVVSIEAGEVAAGDTVKGQPFASVKNATISREGRPDCQRTVMAFGPAAKIVAALVPGKPVLLAVQNHGGTLRVVGEPRTKDAVA